MAVNCAYSGCKNTADLMVEIDSRQVPLCREHYKNLQEELIKIAITKGESDLGVVSCEKARTRVKLSFNVKVSEKEIEKRLKSMKRFLGFHEDELAKIKTPKRRRRRRTSKSKSKSK